MSGSNVQASQETETVDTHPEQDLPESSNCQSAVIGNVSACSLADNECPCCVGDGPNQPSKDQFDYTVTARRYGSQSRKVDTD